MFSFQNCHIHVVILPQTRLVQIIYPIFFKHFHMQVVLVPYALSNCDHSTHFERYFSNASLTPFMALINLHMQ